jgi:hypothetical protein
MINNDDDFKNYLEIYHFYEEYDSNKYYDGNVFEMDYGRGNLSYIFELHILRNNNMYAYPIVSSESIYFNNLLEQNEDNVKFVIALEILSKMEKDKLIKYCNCDYHKSNFIMKMKKCKCCCGCIDSTKPSQKVINETRLNMNNDKNVTVTIFQISSPFQTFHSFFN